MFRWSEGSGFEGSVREAWGRGVRLRHREPIGWEAFVLMTCPDQGEGEGHPSYSCKKLSDHGRWPTHSKLKCQCMICRLGRRDLDPASVKGLWASDPAVADRCRPADSGDDHSLHLSWQMEASHGRLKWQSPFIAFLTMPVMPVAFRIRNLINSMIFYSITLFIFLPPALSTARPQP